MSIKPYLSTICKKQVKSINRLIRYVNAYTSHLYPKFSHKFPQYKYHYKKVAFGKNWEDENDLLDKTITTTTTNDTLRYQLKIHLRKGYLQVSFYWH